MTFFLDHDVPVHIADLLRRHGHKVGLVAEVMAPDSSAEEVFAYAIKANAIMVSCATGTISSNWPRLSRIRG